VRRPPPPPPRHPPTHPPPPPPPTVLVFLWGKICVFSVTRDPEDPVFPPRATSFSTLFLDPSLHAHPAKSDPLDRGTLRAALQCRPPPSRHQEAGDPPALQDCTPSAAANTLFREGEPPTTLIRGSGRSARRKRGFFSFFCVRFELFAVVVAPSSGSRRGEEETRPLFSAHPWFFFLFSWTEHLFDISFLFRERKHRPCKGRHG